MNIKNEKYIEKQLQLFFQLKEYFESEEENIRNYFYWINFINYQFYKNIFSFMDDNTIHFLDLYFNKHLNIQKKLVKLNIKNKNDYYYTYKKILKKVITEVNKNGIYKIDR